MTYGFYQAFGHAITVLNLSASATTDGASVGDVIGTLSVSNPVGSYTYSLTSNPGSLFSIAGNQLKVATTLTAGLDPITISANNGAGSVISASFTIAVSATGGSSGSDSDPYPVIF